MGRDTNGALHVAHRAVCAFLQGSCSLSSLTCLDPEANFPYGSPATHVMQSKATCMLQLQSLGGAVVVGVRAHFLLPCTPQWVPASRLAAWLPSLHLSCMVCHQRRRHGVRKNAVPLWHSGRGRGLFFWLWLLKGGLPGEK